MFLTCCRNCSLKPALFLGFFILLCETGTSSAAAAERVGNCDVGCVDANFASETDVVDGSFVIDVVSLLPFPTARGCSPSSSGLDDTLLEESSFSLSFMASINCA